MTRFPFLSLIELCNVQWAVGFGTYSVKKVIKVHISPKNVIVYFTGGVL